MSGIRSASGLVCAHGSHMDQNIPRPKMPKSALPPELRRKMGFKPRDGEHDTAIYTAGSGVLLPVGSGVDGTFLKKNSSVPMSKRTSGLARIQGTFRGQRAVIPRAKTVENTFVGQHHNRGGDAIGKQTKQTTQTKQTKRFSLPPISMKSAYT